MWIHKNTAATATHTRASLSLSLTPQRSPAGATNPSSATGASSSIATTC